MKEERASLEASYKERSWQKTLNLNPHRHVSLINSLSERTLTLEKKKMSKWILTGFCHYILFDGRQPQKHPKTLLGEMLLLRVRLEPHTGHQTLTNASQKDLPSQAMQWQNEHLSSSHQVTKKLTLHLSLIKRNWRSFLNERLRLHLSVVNQNHMSAWKHTQGTFVTEQVVLTYLGIYNVHLYVTMINAKRGYELEKRERIKMPYGRAWRKERDVRWYTTVSKNKSLKKKMEGLGI